MDPLPPGDVLPPSPYPGPHPWPGSPSWPPPPATPPRPRRSIAAAALAGIFIAGLLVGIAAGHVRLPTSTGVSPLFGGQPLSPGSRAESSSAAAVIPGVVDVDVSFNNGDGSGAGTGMVITSTGEVLTNNHVIDGAGTIEVRISGTGPTYSAHVLGYDVSDDVALLQIDGTHGKLQTVPIGSSSSLSVGEAVTAVGNALGRSGPPAVTSGQITALDQQITATDIGGANAETLDGLIQVDALIQPGDSGGPLVDSSTGKVIGMNTAAEGGRRFRFRPSASRAGFAIPINSALAVVRNIESGHGGGGVTVGQDRAVLGVETQDGDSSGAEVVGVQPGSPAAQAGIRAGDVITGFDGKRIDSSGALRAGVLAHHPGDRVQVGWTDTSGRSRTGTLTLTAGPPA